MTTPKLQIARVLLPRRHVGEVTQGGGLVVSPWDTELLAPLCGEMTGDDTLFVVYHDTVQVGTMRELPYPPARFGDRCIGLLLLGCRADSVSHVQCARCEEIINERKKEDAKNEIR